MNGPMQPQDPEFEGRPYHEKRIHKTHFQGVMNKPKHPRDDPKWEQIAPGRWRKKKDSDYEYV